MNQRNRTIVIVATTLALGARHSSAAGVTIVKDGAPTAVIAISRDVSERVQQAAQTLADFIRQASGVELPVLKDDAPLDTTGAIIQIGRTSPARPGQALPKDLDEDGFVIIVKGNSIAILGATDWGTEFGVYEFLERFVGVRWLLPGPDGTDVLAVKTITVPEGTIKDEPVFFSRLFSGLRGDAQMRWARFNRMHGRVSFHHNLIHLFPPETYTKTHPEFFPMKDGKTRFLPPTNNTHGWQPCFSEPGTVDEAIKNIVDFFNKNPETTSFSLGVNDSSGQCRCPRCLEQVPEEKNFLGMSNYSDLYYAWCNKVIEGVLKVHPNKWFGCLAYSEVAAPPTKVKVHPRMIPYMTYDRMKWIHPEVEAAGHAATEAWAKASPTLGWYDYIYGSPYAVPRVFFHKSQEYLQYGHKQGVRVHYAELYPNWGEGPKPYIFLKLWWNPDRNVDALLKEWYERCVGVEAAPYLAKYYEIRERFWTKDILTSRWFSVGGQYLNFGSPTYLADVSEQDILDSRKLLDTCIAKCQTDKQRARAQLLTKAFQYYEASALAYQAEQKSGILSVNTEAEALAALDNAERVIGMAKQRLRLALDEFPKDPVLVHPLDIERFQAYYGSTWGGGALWITMDWVARGDNAVRKKVAELARSSESHDIRGRAQLMLDIVDGKITPVSTNSSFEEGKGEGADGWGYWVKPDPVTNKTVGKMLRSEEMAHTGKYSLLCDSMYRGGPVLTLKELKPGKYCAMGWVYTPEGQESKGMAELALTPRGDDGNNLPGLSTKINPIPGRWTLVVAGGEIPEQINGTKVTNALLIPIVEGFRDGKVYWDDVSLYRVDK